MFKSLNPILALAAFGLAQTAGAAPTPVPPEENSEQVVEAPSLISINTGKGVAIRLPRAAKNVFIADAAIANINIASGRLVYVFGAADGETTLYAVDAQDHVIYSAAVRVGNNISQLQQVLKLAVPSAAIDVKTLNGIVFLNGYVGSPRELEEVGRLTQQMVGPKQLVINRLQTQTPVQVYLQVRFAEVDRDLIKLLSTSFKTNDTTSGFQFGFFGTRDFLTSPTTSTLPLLDPTTRQQVILPNGVAATYQQVTSASRFALSPEGAYSALLHGGLYGLAIDAAVDALEREGMVSVLSEPTLVALSGEKASFLAGGEFPIPVSEQNGQISIAFKQYGVGLEFTPVVFANNRISMRVKPEVSQITEAGAVRTASISVPGIQTRRAETVVEMGSGESFVIAGLLQNNTSTSISKLPGIGSVPILGALAKSDRFERQETELVIVVTPYLVKPTKPDQVRLPTDGLQVSNDLRRYFLNETFRKGYHAPQSGSPNATGSLPDVGTSNSSEQPTVKPGYSFGQR